VEDGREISRRAGEKQAIQGGDPHCTLTALCSLVHLQDRFWAMSCSAAYESAERTTRSLVNAHKASLSITQKVS